MNKRVLMIAFYYYPHSSSGPHRPAAFAKYLPRYAWTPTVLTVDWTEANARGMYDPKLKEAGEVCDVVRVPLAPAPSRTVRSVFRVLSARLFPYRWPMGFGRRMLRKAEDLVRREAFDVIWSTCGPGVDHRVADRLSRRHGIPWVADFRDLPDQIEDTPTARRTVRTERRVCASTSAMVCVNQWHADRLASRHEVPVYVIPNGYDPADFPSAGPHRSNKFTIAYFGTLYRERYDLRPLLVAIDRLVQRGDMDVSDVEVALYTPSKGSPLAGPPPYVRDFGCAPAVSWSDWVPYHEMIRRQQKATVLLLLSASGAPGITTGKIFGYLASGRPVLNVPADNGVVDDLLAESRGGRSASTPEEIAEILKTWYDEWKQTGTVACHGREEVIQNYSREVLTGRLAGVLEDVVTAGPTDPAGKR